jgi:hypothetical protein
MYTLDRTVAIPSCACVGAKSKQREGERELGDHDKSSIFLIPIKSYIKNPEIFRILNLKEFLETGQ